MTQLSDLLSHSVKAADIVKTANNASSFGGSGKIERKRDFDDRG